MPEEKYRCEKCGGMEFNSKTELDEHNRVSHEGS